MVIDAQLINSNKMIVADPTQAGKTTFVHDLLNTKQLVFTSQPMSQIYWICSEIPNNKRIDCTYITSIAEE